MNVGGGTVATYEFLTRCARGEVVVAFVGKCRIEKKSGVGTQSYPDYVRLGSVSGGGKVAFHVWRDLVDFCKLVGCENRFVSVEIGGGVADTLCLGWRCGGTCGTCLVVGPLRPLGNQVPGGS